MSSSKSSHRRKKPLPYGKIAALIAIPTVALTTTGFLMSKVMGEEKMSTEYCFERPDQAEHAFYVDASHTIDLSDRQRRDYKRIFEIAYEQASANTRVMVFTSQRDASGSVAKPVAMQCKPAATVSEMDAIGAPKKPAPYTARQAEEARVDFNKMIDRVLSDVQNAEKTALESPILEDLQALSRYNGFQGRYRSLTAVTDGIQNSETARFCFIKGDLPPFSTFKTQRRYGYVTPESFDGIRVDLMLVESTSLPHWDAPYCTHHEIRRFWPDYFKDNGAVKVTLTRLRHGA